jgi:pimeloyl-ACP methyl ester carboxylesterase
LELAGQHPTRVASLALLEPVLLMTPAGAAFGRAMVPLIERYQAGDAEGAVHGFLALEGDRNWREAIDQTVPGGIAQAVKDAATFFEAEVPGVPEWTFGPEQAAAITCPVLSVLGSNSSPLFVEGRQLLHAGSRPARTPRSSARPTCSRWRRRAGGRSDRRLPVTRARCCATERRGPLVG